MSPNQSERTVAVAFRLPTEVYEKLRKSVESPSSRHDTVNAKLRARIIYDTLRKH